MDVLKKIAMFLVISTLTYSQASGQTCTSGFLNLSNKKLLSQKQQLVPLFGRQGDPDSELWIFPSLTFTCHGKVTGWVFRGEPGVIPNSPCRVHFTMWRQNAFTGLYTQTATTEFGSIIARVKVDESVYTYELVSPMEVQPADIVGIETQLGCTPTDTSVNVLSLNVSENEISVLSYWTSLNSSLLFSEADIIPLVMPVIEPLDYYTYGDVSTAAVIASIVFIIVIIIVLAVAIPLCCCCQCVRVHLHLNSWRRGLDRRSRRRERRSHQEEEEEEEDQRQNDSRPSEVPMQDNLAYSVQTANLNNGHSAMIGKDPPVTKNQAYREARSHDQSCDETDNESEEYVDMISHSIASDHRTSNPGHITSQASSKMPTQQNQDRPNFGKEEYSYDYI